MENFKCLDCHAEIKSSIERSKGFHSQTKVKGKLCSQCHAEHFGPDFDIRHFDKDKFEHSSVGFVLDGKHSEIKCQECHKADFIKNEKIKSFKNSFLGLSTDCSNCHQDFHQGTLSNDCKSCHNTTKFRPAVKFDHNNTKFILTGSHKNVDCEKCHAKSSKNGVQFQAFAGIKFNNCTSCHKDVHKGKFGANCQSCHQITSFKKIKNRSGFNHSLTNYKLIGKHVNVKCESCHKGSRSFKPKYQKCENCHKDFHKGQLKRNNDNRDCKDCHTPEGFNPSKFTIEDHAKSKFALSGGHTATPCFECHRKNAEWNFNFESVKCSSCHSDFHNGFISPAFYSGSNCLNCHNTNSWQVTDFDHSKTKFKLNGKHSQIKCVQCHFKINNGINVQVFKNLEQKCENCHGDFHQGQFIAKYKNDCLQCHTNINWEPEKFNHSATDFPLDGKHKNLLCVDCHKPQKKGDIIFVKFIMENITCASCHSS